MKKRLLLVLLIVVELGGCYAGARGCGWGPHHHEHHEGQRGGCGCACGV